MEEGLAEVEVELQDNRNCLLEDIIDRLSSVASQLRVPQDSETLFSLWHYRAGIFSWTEDPQLYW